MVIFPSMWLCVCVCDHLAFGGVLYRFWNFSAWARVRKTALRELHTRSHKVVFKSKDKKEKKIRYIPTPWRGFFNFYDQVKTHIVFPPGLGWRRGGNSNVFK